MLEILDNNKESNFNNANSFKSPPLFFRNLYSPRNIHSTMDINERLPIQMLLVNKQYTLKASVWENIKESHQQILTHVQNIKGSFDKLYNLPYTLCEKHGYKYCVYKQNSKPYFRGIYSRCYLGSKSCGKVCANNILLFCQLIRIQESLLNLELIIPQSKKRAKSTSANNPAEMPTKKV